jgi:hypothetical protein
MDIFAIIQLIMQIIAVIMEMLGGTAFSRVLTPDQNRPVYLAAHQWECQSPYWQAAPEVKNNLFSGTVALDCEVEGSSGGGLVEARQHLISELPFQVSTVNAGPLVRNFEGLPSNAFDVSIRVQTSDEMVQMEGRTDIATDGFTRLRSVFATTRTPEEGSARYLKSVVDELDIQPASRAGWYKVTMRYASQIARPWFVSSKTFLEQIVQKQEEKLLNRREQVLNDLASHL